MKTKTYGDLRLDGKSWVLENIAPHVSVKIKRWFSRIDVAAKTLRLTSTPENSSELEWFMERFPFRATKDAAQELRSRSRAHRQRQEKVESLLADQATLPEVSMAKPPRQYQNLAAEMCYTTGAILVADELGLGKTVTAIALLARRGTLPATIVVPINVLEQWARKINEFLPSLSVYIVRTSVEGESPKRFEERQKAHVVLIAYSRLSSWSSTLLHRTLIFDEVQDLRRGSSQKYMAAVEARSSAERCMGLSATPIFNYGGEFFNVMSVISPGSLGERDEFVREWCPGGGDNLRIADPLAFGEWLREQGLMIRRSRADVKRELPPIVRVIVDVPLGTEDGGELEAIAWRALYGGSKDRFSARGEFDHRLRQWTGIAKAPAVAAFVSDMIESTGEPVLLAGWHHAVYEIWKEKLASLNPAFYTGIESGKAKDEAARKLISGETKLLIMSLRSGQGLDGLQGVCRRVVYGELDWAPPVHQQLTGRVHRDGQQETTMEYWAISDEGSDPVILDTLGVKRWQSDAVIDPKGERVLEVQSDPGAIKKLAEEYLRKRGHDPKKPPADHSQTP
jgi:SNF2 family DNA or RNA helicase